MKEIDEMAQQVININEKEIPDRLKKIKELESQL